MEIRRACEKPEWVAKVIVYKFLPKNINGLLNDLLAQGLDGRRSDIKLKENRGMLISTT
jgi:hypothetical protein